MGSNANVGSERPHSVKCRDSRIYAGLRRSKITGANTESRCVDLDEASNKYAVCETVSEA